MPTLLPILSVEHPCQPQQYPKPRFRAISTRDRLRPEVVAYLPEHNALITRFVPGKLLNAEDVQSPDTMGRIAQTLRRCHDAPIPDHLGEFSVFQTVRDYLNLAAEKNVTMPTSLVEALTALQRVEKGLNSSHPQVLTHNDLLAANFIDDGVNLRVIDWEYGGKGDRFFDLGNFAANLQLTEQQEQALLHAYFGEVRPEDLRHLQIMRLASDLREAAWGYLQSGISKLHSPKYYLDYGAKHFDRFSAAARKANVV
ncbi:MAG: hypothetical protein FJ271_01315 [Planctomycetes bacterium]|nr:hypothetical protein [Planctomycetota bacterium]